LAQFLFRLFFVELEGRVSVRKMADKMADFPPLNGGVGLSGGVDGRGGLSAGKMAESD